MKYACIASNLLVLVGNKLVDKALYLLLFWSCYSPTNLLLFNELSLVKLTNQVSF